MNGPLVSVIIPVWNVESYIERCIDSVYNQTYDNIEVIIVDDQSPDNSINIVRDYISKVQCKRDIKIITHEKNLGLGGARLTGIQNVHGKYILAIDSDDWFERDYISSMVEYAERDNCDIIISDYYAETNSKTIIYEQRFSGNGEDFTRMIMAGKLQSFVWNKLIKHSLFTENNIYPIIGIDMWEDVSLICKLASKATRVESVSKAYYHYNLQNINSYSTNGLSVKAIESMFRAVEDIVNYFSSSAIITTEDLLLLKSRAKSMAISSNNCPKKYVRKFPEIKLLPFMKRLYPIENNLILILNYCQLDFLIRPLMQVKLMLKSVLHH